MCSLGKRRCFDDQPVSTRTRSASKLHSSQKASHTHPAMKMARTSAPSPQDISSLHTESKCKKSTHQHMTTEQECSSPEKLLEALQEVLTESEYINSIGGMNNFATWNMQGASSFGESKWGSMIRLLLTGYCPNKKRKIFEGNNVICLQEAGCLTGGAGFTKKAGIQTCEIQVGSRKRGFLTHVTYHHWGTANNRCSLAIVSKSEPTQYLCLPKDNPTWRPAIGIKVHGLWYFTLHAISPNGPDASSLLECIKHETGAEHWIAAGDYNIDLNSCDPFSEYYLCRPNNNTHPSDEPVSKLDYAYSSLIQLTGAVYRESLPPSDHLPVLYSLK